MERFTIQNLLKGDRNAILCNSQLEWEKMCEIKNKNDLKDKFHMSRDKTFNLNDLTTYWSVSTKNEIEQQGYKLIEFNQIDFEENLLNNIQIW